MPNPPTTAAPALPGAVDLQEGEPFIVSSADGRRIYGNLLMGEMDAAQQGKPYASSLHDHVAIREEGMGRGARGGIDLED